MCWYRDVEYASSRLSGTIVRLKDGTPIKIIEVDGSLMVTYVRLSDNNTSHFCDMRDLDIEPVPLGYINYSGHALYLTRQPKRNDWKQGLRRSNFVYTTESGGQSRFDSIPFKSLADCIVNNYPTITEAIRLLNERNTVAISREFALKSGGDVLYKNVYKVGSVSGGELRIDERYEWLEEELEGIAA